MNKQKAKRKRKMYLAYKKRWAYIEGLGGMSGVLAGNSGLYDLCQSLRDHGIRKDVERIIVGYFEVVIKTWEPTVAGDDPMESLIDNHNFMIVTATIAFMKRRWDARRQ